MAGWAVLIAVASAWGIVLVAREPRIILTAPPLLGAVEPRIGLWVLPAVAMAVAAVARAPALAGRLSWRGVLVAALVGSALWAVALAVTEGPDGLVRPVRSPHEYRHDIPLISSPGMFLDTFTERISRYTTHVRGHPPGITLVAWSLERVGLGGPWPLAALFILGGALAAPAALTAVRETAGEPSARRAAPFLVLAPAAIWVATSADALFAGTAAWAAALIVLATGRADGRGDLLALAGGVLFGVALNLSYGVLLVWTIPAMVAAARHRPRPLLIGAAGTVAVVGVVALSGFWWVEGLLATRAEYLGGVSRFRPYGYFLVANLAAVGIATGPAVPAALARLRRPGLWLLVAAGLAAVLVADLSGLSKGEVERIWLPFVPWLLVATAALPPSRARAWLAAQATVALVVELLLRTTW